MATKRKLTQAEKDAQEKERELKKQKKADEVQAKEAAKAAKAAEKAKMDAEKEAKKAAKAAEKAEVEAKKEAIRKQKEEQEQALQRKRAKQQNMLAAFVKRAPSTPVKTSTTEAQTPATAESASPTVTTTEPAAPQVSAYHRLFQPFFVKSDVTLATVPFKMDDNAKNVKSSILDELIYKKREAAAVHPFNPAQTFEVHGFFKPRGITQKSVKEIMEAASSEHIKSESQTSSNELIDAQRQLNHIPMKALKFYEDVRPPYIGTITTPLATSTLRRLSRRPTGRNVENLNYDYDSEAEWQDDDGEDLMSEDEEEDADGDDELDDFLDDSDDVPPLARPTFLGETQPTVVGICFEGEKDKSSSVVLENYKMEFLLETLPDASIDPFSTSYWEKPKKKAKESAPSMLAAATTNSTLNTMQPPPAHAFAVLIRSNGSGSGSSSTTPSPAIDQKDMVPADILEDFKRTIVSEGFREHTKLTVIDLLSKKFTSCTKPQVKKTLEHIAVRETVPGAAKSCKHWRILPAFSV
ncbi:chromatin assembly factor 1 subunit A-domain-containing protein [Microdochium trichocladiopsis]|uniref:Chromatin assembly factor 1 subunit A-domain-containing protein n=1 Tax=Microdochium trichocladiopsis TaxID=1682393 RepID=A0A9P8YBT3_9PEZI|nr:chromatin assembly factor 1 subunit A-domain-containing protein [Microdochium trichocladiopsis]KAH7033434.1 chromatin assembly factor 1 subunit A-domain-containing protein [Microdochium trichocladiopsis]